MNNNIINIELNKDSFLNFLHTILKFCDKGTINFENDNINLITYNSTDLHSIIFYIKIFQKNNINNILKISFPSFKRIYKLISNINENNFILKYNGKSISYNSESYGFNYNLLSENFLEKNIINIDKINNIEYTTTFQLTKFMIENIINLFDTLNDLFSNKNDQKIYINGLNNKINFFVTNKKNPNFDSTYYTIDCPNINNFEIILNVYIFRLLMSLYLSLKIDIFNVKINNQKSIISFEYQDENKILKLVTSGKVE